MDFLSKGPEWNFDIDTRNAWSEWDVQTQRKQRPHHQTLRETPRVSAWVSSREITGPHHPLSIRAAQPPARRPETDNTVPMGHHHPPAAKTPQHLDWPASLQHAALTSADPARAVAAALASSALTSQGQSLLAIGKASVAMTTGATRAIASLHPTRTLILAPADASPSSLPPAARLLHCDHPYPTARNVAAAREVEAFVRGCPRGSSLLLLLSGGASAYLASPAPGLTLEDLAAITRDLQRAGATIRELNTIRKHLERLKGGRLGALCPVPMSALILSDVLGDPLDIIGSGPVTPDPSTFADALAIIERLNLAQDHAAVARHLREGTHNPTSETPKPGDSRLSHVTTQIIANNARVVNGVADACRAMHWHIAHIEHDLQGQSHTAARQLIQQAASSPPRIANDAPRAWIAGGETTVDLRNARSLSTQATGGPSQELALEAARLIARLTPTRDLQLWAFSTDGRDGPTDAAGALISSTTWDDIRRAGLDPDQCLRDHNSHAALNAAHALIRTGETGTNLNHVWVLVEGAPVLTPHA